MKRNILVLLTVLWLVCVGVGMGVLASYENAPGIPAHPEEEWPRSSHVQRAASRPTLVMLAHPQCPCSRASIGELALIMAHCHDRVEARVLFLRPKGVPVGWEKSDLWKSAAAIPGVQVVGDERGQEAQRFHAKTSGQTLLFDREGHLIFSGGITGSRGHSGDNAGRDAIVSLIDTGKSTRHSTFVFGCSLVEPNSKQ